MADETLTQVEPSDLRAALREVMDGDKKITQASIAREAGLSPSAINQWLKATYNGDNDAVEAKLVRWLEGLRAQRSTNDAMPEAPAWIQTPTSDKVMGALRYAQAAGDMAIAYGGAGVGKTKSIQRYRSSALNVWVATMTPASASVVTALEEICEAIGIRMGANGGGAAKLHREILKKVAGTNGLIVIDEAQHLSIAALDQIRSIHDATGIGVALVGNESVYARMTGGNRAPYLDRLFSRIGKKVRVTKATEGDITSIISAWGIEDKACRQQLVDIANRPGALRALTKVLRLGAMFAAAQKRKLCCEDIRAAWRELGGVE